MNRDRERYERPERLDRDTQYLLAELLDTQGREWGPPGYGPRSARTHRLEAGGYVETRKLDGGLWHARLTESGAREAQRGQR